MSVSFVILSDDDVTAMGLDPSVELGAVAIDDDSLEVLSVCTRRTNNRYRFCTTCVGNCVAGGIVWTRRSAQQQGLFTSLYAFMQEHYGWDKDYVIKVGPFHDVLAERWGLSRPELDVDLPREEDFNTFEEYKQVEAMADIISERAGTVWRA